MWGREIKRNWKDAEVREIKRKIITTCGSRSILLVLLHPSWWRGGRVQENCFSGDSTFSQSKLCVSVEHRCHSHHLWWYVYHTLLPFWHHATGGSFILIGYILKPGISTFLWQIYAACAYFKLPLWWRMASSSMALDSVGRQGTVLGPYTWPQGNWRQPANVNSERNLSEMYPHWSCLPGRSAAGSSGS